MTSLNPLYRDVTNLLHHDVTNLSACRFSVRIPSMRFFSLIIFKNKLGYYTIIYCSTMLSQNLYDNVTTMTSLTPLL